MSDEPLFVDVNIAMYAAGMDHPYKDACSWVLSEVAGGQFVAAIDTEIIQELLYRYGALGQPQLAAAIATNLLELIPVVLPVSYEDARIAIELFVQLTHTGARARDVIHAAVMRNNGISRIISVDRHFDHFPGIVRLDPRVMFAGRN